MAKARGGAKPASVLPSTDIRKFRHDVAILKRKGLIGKTTDARSAVPTKYLRAQIRQWSEVIAGRATTVKVSNDSRRFYKASGFETKGNRVVVPIQPNQKVVANRGNFTIVSKGQSGSISSRNLQIKADNVLDYLNKLRANEVQLKDDEYIAFQFFGNNSKELFYNNGRRWQDKLADYLERYKAVQLAAAKGSYSDNQTIIENIHLIKVKEGGAKPVSNPVRQVDPEAARRRAESRKAARNRRLEKMSTDRLDEYLDARAAASKRYRNRLSDEKYDAMLQAGKERARKARAKKNAATLAAAQRNAKAEARKVAQIEKYEAALRKAQADYRKKLAAYSQKIQAAKSKTKTKATKPTTKTTARKRARK